MANVSQQTDANGMPGWVQDEVVSQLGTPDEQVRVAQWEQLAGEIVQRRQEAVAYRQNERIEHVWAQCEEVYQCVDDMNRGDYPSPARVKTLIQAGSGGTGGQKKDKTRSRAYVRMGARYVDAAKAKVGEMVIPIDEKVFTFHTTPVPGKPAAAQMGPVKPTAAPADDPMAVAMAKAETRIQDWLVEGQFTTELRKVIADAARLGTGAIKGPVPCPKKRKRPVQLPTGQWSVQPYQDVRPMSQWVDPWNLFPDPACGENIHKGDFILERDFMARRQVQGLRRDPTYDQAVLAQVLREGPKRSGTATGSDPRPAEAQHLQYEVWYYYGMVPADVLAVKYPDVAEDAMSRRPGDRESKDLSTEDVAVVATLINDQVVRVVMNPMDSGDFPYDVIAWERRPGLWAGIGIAEQILMAQKLINSATRSLINNAAISAGPQIVFDEDGIEPDDGTYDIVPNKIWRKTARSSLDDVEKAFQVYEIPSRTADLLRIVEYAFRLAEESTNMPLVTQGQSGKTQPDTFGGMQLLNTNANQLLREIVSNFDEQLLEPHLERYYEWLLVDERVPADEKGDWAVQAQGSNSLIERDAQFQIVQYLVELSRDPAYELSPKRVVDELLNLLRWPASKLKYTPTELQQVLANQPKPPNVQVAEIKAGTMAQQLQAKLDQALATLELQKDQLATQLAQMAQTVEGQAQAEETKRMKIQLDFQTALLQYATQRQISLEQAKVEMESLKADLAKEVMKLDTQKELAAMEAGGEAATAPTEPAGKAPKGQGYQA